MRGAGRWLAVSERDINPIIINIVFINKALTRKE